MDRIFFRLRRFPIAIFGAGGVILPYLFCGIRAFIRFVFAEDKTDKATKLGRDYYREVFSA